MKRYAYALVLALAFAAQARACNFNAALVAVQGGIAVSPTFAIAQPFVATTTVAVPFVSTFSVATPVFTVNRVVAVNRLGLFGGFRALSFNSFAVAKVRPVRAVQRTVIRQRLR